jgi:hypothetical protein
MIHLVEMGLPLATLSKKKIRETQENCCSFCSQNMQILASLGGLACLEMGSRASSRVLAYNINYTSMGFSSSS